MKTFAMIAAAGSLAAITAPAAAADIAPRTSGFDFPATMVVFDSFDENAQHGNHPPRHARAYGRRYKDKHYDRNDDYDDRYDDRRTYNRYGQYNEPRRIHRGDRVWRGNDGRYYCQRANGTTGLIIGAAGGALIGRELDRRGDRALGTILGAAVGGLIGREIERGRVSCR